MKDVHPSSSRETVTNRRHYDVFMEALLRLPVRSLVRLRCVSKSWCAFIKNPTFATDHFLKHRENDTMLLVRRYLPRPEDKDVFSFHDINSPELDQIRPNISVPFSRTLACRDDGSYITHQFILVGPCNGVLCIIKWDAIILCNPGLHEYVTLPTCPFTSAKTYGDEIVAEGFGCSDTNDFKVILIRHITSRTKYDPGNYNMAHLYSSKTNTWRNIPGDAIVNDEVRYYPSSQHLFKCFYHWHGTFYDYNRPKVMLTFNVSTECFGQLGYPENFVELRGNSLTFTTIKNCLAMVLYPTWMTEPSSIDIWVMEEYGVRESWSKMFEIGPYHVIRPLISWKNDEWLLVESNDGQLAACGLNIDEIKRFQICGVETTLRSLIYKESLISLNRILK